MFLKPVNFCSLCRWKPSWTSWSDPRVWRKLEKKKSPDNVLIFVENSGKHQNIEITHAHRKCDCRVPNWQTTHCTGLTQPLMCVQFFSSYRVSNNWGKPFLTCIYTYSHCKVAFCDSRVVWECRWGTWVNYYMRPSVHLRCQHMSFWCPGVFGDVLWFVLRVLTKICPDMFNCRVPE